MLGNTNFDLQVCLILDNFDKINAKESWETIKLKIQSLSQKSTCFHQRQAIRELKSTELVTKVNMFLSETGNKRIEVFACCFELYK